jgi:hypothetical protein
MALHRHRIPRRHCHACSGGPSRQGGRNNTTTHYHPPAPTHAPAVARHYEEVYTLVHVCTTQAEADARALTLAPHAAADAAAPFALAVTLADGRLAVYCRAAVLDLYPADGHTVDEYTQTDEQPEHSHPHHLDTPEEAYTP